MELSEKEKEIVKGIATGTIFDAFSYAMYFCNDLLIPFHANSSNPDGTTVQILLLDDFDYKQFGDHISYIKFFVKDISSLRERLISFLSILSILEDAHLIIRIFDIKIPQFKLYFYYDDPRIYNDFISLSALGGRSIIKGIRDLFNSDLKINLPSLYQMRFLPTSNMSFFIKDNRFLTRTEVHNQKSLRSAKIGAWIAIITALLGLAINLWSNYSTSKTTAEQFRSLNENLRSQINDLKVDNQKLMNQLLEKIDAKDMNITVPEPTVIIQDSNP